MAASGNNPTSSTSSSPRSVSFPVSQVSPAQDAVSAGLTTANVDAMYQALGRLATERAARAEESQAEAQEVTTFQGELMELAKEALQLRKMIAERGAKNLELLTDLAEQEDVHLKLQNEATRLRNINLELQNEGTRLPDGTLAPNNKVAKWSMPNLEMTDKQMTWALIVMLPITLAGMAREYFV
jgi:hypothetical protein